MYQIVKAGGKSYKVCAQADTQQGGFFPDVVELHGRYEGAHCTNLAGQAGNAQTAEQAIKNGIKALRANI